MADRRRILRSPASRRDVLEIADYIANDNPDAAQRFIEAVMNGERELLDWPKMGAPRTFRNPALTGLRIRRVPGFPNHLIFYRPHATGIEVIRVLHAARDLHAIFEDEV